MYFCANLRTTVEQNGIIPLIRQLNFIKILRFDEKNR
jgi:hypothetical protein